MISALDRIVRYINANVGELIDVSEMSAEDKAAIKAHALAIEEILLRNGSVKLQAIFSALTGAVLSRLG